MDFCVCARPLFAVITAHVDRGFRELFFHGLQRATPKALPGTGADRRWTGEWVLAWTFSRRASFSPHDFAQIFYSRVPPSSFDASADTTASVLSHQFGPVLPHGCRDGLSVLTQAMAVRRDWRMRA